MLSSIGIQNSSASVVSVVSLLWIHLSEMNIQRVVNGLSSVAASLYYFDI